ncbi:aldehyde dehydrogenase [Corynespora cassiicola Philippines]|uniref:aldehyde dehydrogenase (NAD(+)) n=1 Tax=Corynespora cassiicola Philippines TaxID=1448308 RepID=A0A2T2NX06_CORCC|nr:aldehyde dehydrogenase [Corynespora cassiicola Philippines]
MAPKLETRLFINGQFVEAKSSARFSCYNPKDNSLVADNLPEAGEEDVNAAVAAARAAFPGWAATSPTQRQAILLKFADLIEAHAKELAEAEVLTNGKPFTMISTFEVGIGVKMLRHDAGYCDKLHGESVPPDSETGMLRIVTNEPLGVCAGICPFNVPLAMAMAKASPAMAAGNTIVLKPSEKTPLGTLILARLTAEAGLPPGVFNVVLGAGATGALLASHMDVNKISFTGSSPVGKKIAAAAANSNLKRVSLELGGKSAAIVFPDANLDVAVQWCTAGITTATGQGCICTSRVYVHKSIKDEFLLRYKEAMKGVEALAGDPALATTGFGPLVDKKQFDRVMGYIDIGKKEASLLQGGEQIGPEGCFVQPTIFVDPQPDARILTEEIFGPVVVVSEFEDEADVIARANDSKFGLSGAVYSQDINRALRVASKIQSGTMCVNCSLQGDPEVPFGGFKESGWGREYGKNGILSFTEPKTTFVK